MAPSQYSIPHHVQMRRLTNQSIQIMSSEVTTGLLIACMFIFCCFGFLILRAISRLPTRRHNANSDNTVSTTRRLDTLPRHLHRSKTFDKTNFKGAKEQTSVQQPKATSSNSPEGAAQEFDDISSIPFESGSETCSHSNGTCIICYDDFVPDDVVTRLHCGHQFHHRCLSQWITKSQNWRCPLCDQSIFPPVPDTIPEDSATQ